MPEPRTHVRAVATTDAGEVRLYTGGRFMPDPWQVVDDAAELPPSGPVLVTLVRWRQDRASLAARGDVGVLSSATDVLTVEDDIGSLDLIVLVLPKFTDGRVYSTARRLREQAGYRGELRVTGDVLLDQIPLLARCGFDSFEIRHAPTIRALESGALYWVGHVYQPPGGARRLPVPLTERVRRSA
jgi:uncharacterized protein (DUF934 family)